VVFVVEFDYMHEKIDKMNEILIRQTVVTEKLTEIIDKQDKRIGELEQRFFKSEKWYETKNGSLIIKSIVFVVVLVLCSAIGINVFKLLSI